MNRAEKLTQCTPATILVPDASSSFTTHYNTEMPELRMSGKLDTEWQLSLVGKL